MPGLIKPLSSPQPISRTPSAVGLDNKEVATLMAGTPTVFEIARKKRRRNVIAGASGAFVLGVVLFLVFRTKTESAPATTPVATTIQSVEPVTPTPQSSAASSSAVVVAPNATTSATASASATAKSHVRPTHTGTAQATATQTAPKGTGDVLEDRR